MTKELGYFESHITIYNSRIYVQTLLLKEDKVKFLVILEQMYLVCKDWLNFGKEPLPEARDSGPKL